VKNPRNVESASAVRRFCRNPNFLEPTNPLLTTPSSVVLNAAQRSEESRRCRHCRRRPASLAHTAFAFASS